MKDFITGVVLSFLVSFVLTLVFYEFPNKNRVTVVTITDTTTNFKSNYNRDGDEYYIIKNGDTLSKGVYFNQKWR